MKSIFTFLTFPAITNAPPMRNVTPPMMPKHAHKGSLVAAFNRKAAIKSISSSP
jgi:hypothetical protein